MGIVKRWILSVVVKKMVASAAKSVVTLASTYGISVVATYGGMTLDLGDQAGIAVLINTGLKGAFHALSHKFPSLSWLSPHDEIVEKQADAIPPELCKTQLPG